MLFLTDFLPTYAHTRVCTHIQNPPANLRVKIRRLLALPGTIPSYDLYSGWNKTVLLLLGFLGLLEFNGRGLSISVHAGGLW